MTDELIKIESGIPVPPGKGGRNGRGEWVDLMLRMQIGDSAVIPYVKLSSVYGACRGLGYKIRVQVQYDDYPNVDGRPLRIWRIK